MLHITPWGFCMLAQFRLLLMVSLWLSAALAVSAENLIANPSFEDGPTGWENIWAREKSLIKAEVAAQTAHTGQKAMRVEHTGDKDWNLSQVKKIAVKPGEVYSYSAWIKIESGTGNVDCSVITRDAKDEVLSWQYGMKQVAGVHDWQKISGRFLVPERCTGILFRFGGRGAVTAMLDDIELLKEKDSDATVIPDQAFTLLNGGTKLVCSPAEKTIKLSQANFGPVFTFTGWRQGLLKKIEQPTPSQLKLDFISSEGQDWSAEIQLENNGEILWTMQGAGAMEAPVEFPGPLHAVEDQNWVLPVNEGLLVPALDAYFNGGWEILYSGHGFCMPFIGLVSNSQALIAIAETQNDAQFRYERTKGVGSSWSFVWEPSKGEWGYARKLRMALIKTGGYVGVAKAYREWAKKDGRVVTLKEKLKTVPQLEKLIGAVNFWWWEAGEKWKEDPHPEVIAKEVKEAGIERVLWSHEAKPEPLKAINELGFLTGRYDIVQDVWPTETPVKWLNKEGWPDDIVLLANGDRMKGWVHKDGDKEYPGGVISSKPGLDHLNRKVAEDLKTHPYGARFLDTTTASPLREDYNPKHPLTRSDDRTWKMKQLAALSGDFKLVTGSETGMDMAVPYVHYFEGMMSLGPYRLPDAGYDLFSYKKPSEEFLRFQTGCFYRIPLFELVYHDCVVSYGYWGDGANRVPEVWDERDLFCALYGVPPIFVTDRERWNKDKARYVQSYKTATESARLTALSEMTRHEFLNETHTLQVSEFADGTVVYVNFGTAPEKLPDGKTLAAKKSLVIPGKAP